MRRGMTILEVLLSLALLSALAVASAGLVGLAAATAAISSANQRWQQAAEAVMDCIENDLASGDFDAATDANPVAASKGILTIVTRSAGRDGPSGPTMHEYRFDPQGRILWRDERPIRPGRRTPGRVEASRCLLGRLNGWSATLDAKASLLDIALAGPEGKHLERRFQTR